MPAGVGHDDDAGGAGAAGDDLFGDLATELRDELRAGLDELRGAFADFRDGFTPGAAGGSGSGSGSAGAGGDVDLDGMAKALGVDRKQLEQSIGAARSTQRKDELRPVLKELLDELLSDDDDGSGSGGAGDDGAAGGPPAKPAAARRRKPAAAAAPAAGAPDPDLDGDSGPARPHWTEAGLGGLLK